MMKKRNEEPICYHKPHEWFNTAGGLQKFIHFSLNILKIYIYLRKECKEKNLCYGVGETFLDLLSVCVYLSWSFLLARCCVLTWVTEILMRATLNVHADRRLPTPYRETQRLTTLRNLNRWINSNSVTGDSQQCVMYRMTLDSDR